MIDANEHDGRHGGGDGLEPGRSTVRSLRDDGGPGRMQLLVIGEGIHATYPLPEAGRVVIGRAPGCDVRIDHPSVSRRHAVLHLGQRLAVEDLGSVNGSRVREAWMTPGEAVSFAPGEVVDVGAMMLVVQHRAGPTRPWRVWNHGYFEARLAEECIRAARSGPGFALIQAHTTGTVSPAFIEETLADVVRAVDVVGSYAPGEYEVLLLDSSPAQAADVVARIQQLLAARGGTARIGVAHYPTDGRDGDSLLAHARAAARGEKVDGAAGEIVVSEGAMQRLHRVVERIAAGTISVLIMGETGVGKELLAETVHRLSPRGEKPFLRLNCAALSESLLESELFGHERGAFTGAVQTKPGLLETAQGGTVFLDELGELPPSTQVKLLRVIEARQVLRIGALKARPIDVRFVAATNRDLEAEVERGNFRQDLFFRLNGISLVIPPLRQRVGEIKGLAEGFIAQACRLTGLDAAPPLRRDSLALLERYSWPGNIRELRNVIERALLLSGGGPIGPEHLPTEKMRATLGTRPVHHEAPAPASSPPFVPMPPPVDDMPTITTPLPFDARRTPPILRPVRAEPAPPPAPAPAPPAPPPPAVAEVERLEDIRREMSAIERERILAVLSRCGGNQTEAARILGVSRRTLMNRLDQWGVTRPRKRPKGEP